MKPKLSEWINKYYLEESHLQKLQKEFNQATPFEHIQLHDFLTHDKAVQVLHALVDEKYYEKESDLFKLMQTQDFKSTQIPVLQEFHTLIQSKEFITLMQTITQCTLTQKIDMHSMIYQDTDFLLCHDDRLDSRKIAYLLYFCDLDEMDGGALRLFATKDNKPYRVTKKILPSFNTFTFFKVSDQSFHDVEEIKTDTQRISIGGWFHG